MDVWQLAYFSVLSAAVGEVGSVVERGERRVLLVGSEDVLSPLPAAAEHIYKEFVSWTFL